MTPDPESLSWPRIALAFAVVAGLLALLGLALKYAKVRGLRMPGIAGKDQRLKIVESFALDVRRRLVIVRCDGAEHLLLLGGSQDLIVEKNLQRATPHD